MPRFTLLMANSMVFFHEDNFSLGPSSYVAVCSGAL